MKTATATTLCSTVNALEYLGSSFKVDREQGYALITFQAFRSEAKGEEAFEFMRELYAEQAVRRLIYDVRTALWPADKRALKRRFGRHGERMPRSVIAVVCQDPDDRQMRIGMSAYEQAGHTVHLTASEADAIAFVTRHRFAEPSQTPEPDRRADPSPGRALAGAPWVWRRLAQLFGAA